MRTEAERWNWNLSTYNADDVTVFIAQLPNLADRPTILSTEDGQLLSVMTGYATRNVMLQEGRTKNEWEKQLVEMSGLFTLITQAHEDKSWRIAVDRNSFTPLYYRQLEGCLIVANEVKFLLVGSSPDINFTSLGALLISGYLLCNNTLFHGIDRLPTGSYLQWHFNTTTTHKYWSINDTTLKACSPDSDLISEASHYVTECIKRAISKECRTELLLSGGWDSRWIAAVASSLDLNNIHSTCAVKPNSWKDSSIAPQVAARLGIPHRNLQFSWDTIYSGLVEKVWCLDGLCEEHLWAMQLLPHLPSDGIVYDGFCGDPMMSGTYESGTMLNLFDHNVDWRVRFHNYIGSIEDLDQFVENADKIQSEYSNHLDSCIMTYKDSPFPPLAFGLENRMRNAMSLMEKSIWERRSVFRYPFVDVQLQDFMLGLAPDIRAGGHFNRSMLAHSFPQLRNVRSTHDSHTKRSYLLTNARHRLQRLGRASGLLRPLSPSDSHLQKQALHNEKLRLIEILEIHAPFSKKRLLENLSSGGRQQYGGWDRSLSVLQIIVWYNLFVLGRSCEELSKKNLTSTSKR